jgi:hypothetical protein
MVGFLRFYICTEEFSALALAAANAAVASLDAGAA